MNFADRLKDARKHAGYTQKRLAEQCELATGTIQQYELGVRSPKPENVAKIATALNLGYSFTKDGEPYFYDFVDTVRKPEYEENEEFNRLQMENSGNTGKIVKTFNKLNTEGQDKAIEQVELLTEIPKYQKDKE